MKGQKAQQKVDINCSGRNVTALAVNATGRMKIPASLRIEGLSQTMLWHHRLGHTPIERMKKIRAVKDNIKTGQEECMVCPQAKFTKLPFNSSHSRATEVFELIHIDIWGPYKVPTRKNHRYFLTMVENRKKRE